MVWLASVNLNDILKAQKTKKHPFGHGKKRLHLHTVNSPAQRQAVYDRASRALADIETCLMPTYGGRSWKVTVTVTDPVVTTKSKNKSHPVSPYFVFNKRGLLEIAAWPQILLKIPDPPKFPGYYASLQAKEAAKSAKKKKEKAEKEAQLAALNAMDAEGENEVDGQQSDEEEEEEEIVDQEMEIIYDLQERDVTPISELAFEERWRVPLPQIAIKWVSPMREIFNTRKSAWEHAVKLCKQDVLLEKALKGYDLMRNRPLPTNHVPLSAKKVLDIGHMRFKRDGLWVIGQEEHWKKTREENGEEAYLVLATENPAAKRPLSALQFYIQEHRLGLQKERQHSLESKASLISEEKKEEDQMAEKPKDASHGVAKPKKFTLKDADNELRQKWKTLPSEEKDLWKKKAVDEHSRTNDAVTVTPDTGKGDQLLSSMVLEVSDGESTPMPSSKRHLLASGRVSPPSADESSSDALVIQPPVTMAAETPPSSRSSLTSTPKTENIDRSVAKIQKPKIRVSPSKVLPWQKWCLNKEQIKLCYEAGMKHYDTVIATVQARGLYRELQDGFDVLRERGRGRFDMTLPDFDTPQFSFLTDLKKAPWMPVVHSILGKDVVLIHKGMFLSMPGAEAQPYHQDGVHLTTQTQRDCHAVNVFIPLVDLTMKHGPTEFCLGTHVLDQDEWKAEHIETPVVSAGNPIIFDYRTGHKGLANTSDSCRPIVSVFSEEGFFCRKAHTMILTSLLFDITGLLLVCLRK